MITNKLLIKPLQKKGFLLFLLLFLGLYHYGYNQCGPNTPTFIVDLSNNVDSAWISADTLRNDTCCGAVAPDKCVAFILTLASDAQGIIFDVCDGALPPGALFYQLSCGPQTAVGQVLCLSGPGPHYITFCKPGNNSNKYCITSIPPPSAGPDLSVNDGCIDTLTTQGFSDTSIVWTSIFPGPIGAYDTLLSCTQDCEQTVVNGGNNLPTFIDYQVCGMALGSCGGVSVCDTVRVSFFSTLNVEITPRNPTVCFGQTTAWIKANPQGGSPPYSYSWSNGATSDSIQVGVGTYIVELTDVSGCPPTYDTVTVTAFANPITADAGTDAVVCEQNLPIQLNGVVTAAAGGRWSGGSGTFTPHDSSLTATYQPTTTEINAGSVRLFLTTIGNGSCPAMSDTIDFSIVNYDGPYTSSIQNVSCNGESDGSATINVSGGTGPHSYQWDANAASQTTATAGNLAAGKYYFTISDGNACTVVDSVNIIEPTILQASISAFTAVSCNAGSDGSATAAAAGGTAPYTFAWPSGGNAANETGLAAGSYQVTVSDNNGCTDTATATITEPSTLVATIDSVWDVSCNGGNDGQAFASAGGGTAPYTFAWPSGGGNANEGNLNLGSYTLSLTDANGCTDTITAVINEPTPLTLALVAFTNVSCNGAQDGTAAVAASGGTAPYSYLWPSANTDSLETGLDTGITNVIVRDFNGCTQTLPVSISQPDSLIASISNFQDVSCNGGSDASIITGASGGTTPYTYLWSNSATTASVTNLSAGTYTLTVTDNNACTYVVQQIISEPIALQALINTTQNVSCTGESDGSATATAAGGTAPYTFAWPSGGNAANETGLAAGSYQVTVSDNNGCTDTATATITEPSTLVATIDSVWDVSCNGGNDGQAFASAGGGTAPYTFAWPSGGGNANEGNLNLGSYTLSLTDANGCTDTITAVINEPTPLTLALVAFTNVSCNGAQDGTAAVAASGGTAPYSYLWPSANTDSLETGLDTGITNVIVRDFNGCTQTLPVSISQPDSLIASINSFQDVSCNGGSDASITAGASGGTTPYTYLWSTSATTATVSGLPIGSYTVTISDNNACTSIAQQSITEPGILVPNIVISPISCFGDNDGQISITPSGGTPNYTYAWADGRTSASISSLATGSYTLSLSDANNCSTDTIIVLSEPGPLLVSPGTNDTICIGSNAQVQASASGANGSYTFNWDQGLGFGATHTVSPLATTTYTVSATDSKNCPSNIDSVIIAVRDLNSDTLLAFSGGNICEGQSTTVTATHNGPLSPYTYQWSNGLGNTLGPIVVSPNTTTTYRIQVTDLCGTAIEDSVTVEVETYPLVTLPNQISTGCEPLTVLFTDSLNPSTINYSYVWDFGDGNTSTQRGPVHRYTSPGNYQVRLKITTPGGCESNSNSGGNITVYPTPVPGFDPSPSVSTIESPTIEFFNTSSGANRFRWQFTDSISSSAIDTSITFQDTGRYFVKLIAYNNQGCSDSIIKEVVINPIFNLQIPNAFTPNPNGGNGGTYNPNDLSNDVFFVYAEYVKDFHMSIFNRWGELVFESFDLMKGWDGYYKNSLSQMDVYVYQIEITWVDGSKTRKVGDVTLFR